MGNFGPAFGFPEKTIGTREGSGVYQQRFALYLFA